MTPLFRIALLFCISTLTGQLLLPQTAANSAATDFAQLGRYREANVALPAATSGRIVFLGDSITERWAVSPVTWFSNPEWINRGIGGQTTQQLLLRERADAIALHPRAIVLEAGSNDMRLGYTPEIIRDNMLTMGQLAEANNTRVFITAMTPVCDCVTPLSGLRTVERIHQLNTLLQQMARDHHWHYIDLNTPLADATGHMRAELTVDGVHPNADGYKLLTRVVLRALRSNR
jgi:lysophospholipase L1-like esterase